MAVLASILFLFSFYAGNKYFDMEESLHGEITFDYNFIFYSYILMCIAAAALLIAAYKMCKPAHGKWGWKFFIIIFCLHVLAGPFLVHSFTNMYYKGKDLSPDGKYSLYMYDGEGFTGGPSELVLKDKDETISRYRFTYLVAWRLGPSKENYKIVWHKDYVDAILSGKREGKRTIRLYYSGKVLDSYREKNNFNVSSFVSEKKEEYNQS